jgi:stage II sporulation protein E
MSKAIENLSKDLESNCELDLEKEKNIFHELERNNISVDRVHYLTKSKDDYEIIIEKKTCSDCRLCETKLVDVVSNYMQETLSAQKIGCHMLGEKCNIKLSKSQKYLAMTDVASMSRGGYLLCGDNYTHMEINDGKYMMAISDGMGKGKKAYEESSITIDILEKLVDAKIDDEIVINTINNMLLLKSSDEMFSTLDLGIIDLKKGYLETIKMGACSTYIKRQDSDVDLITSSSLPVGILSEINLDRQKVKVKDGDYIVMVSDGIIDAGKNNNMGDNWLIYFLQNIDSTNPKEISNLILNKALDIQNGEVEDDMTVLVTKIYTSC